LSFNFFNAGEIPSLKAFDKFLHSAVFRLADTCDDLEMENLGRLVTEAFEGMRYVLVLASRAKQPADLIQDLQPHLKPMTDAVSSLRGLKLNRDFDNHMKVIMEMIASVSWLTMRAPSQLPAPFVKECIGSSDFWSNRIRKEFKGKEAPAQIAFCDNTKKLLQELAQYIVEHHATGLAFNPKGVSLAEAAVVLTDNPLKDAAAAAVTKNARSQSKRASLTGNTVQGGNVLGLISELAGRQSEEGDSAATGLKHVS
jgi:adenylyl cyclase-associated protein